MAVFLGRTEIGIKRTGVDVSVPDNPRANLMYYLSCITSVLESDKTDDLRRLTDYRNYRRLSDSDIDQLVLLCYLVSPNELLNKCIFQDDDLCRGCSNEFYELSQKPASCDQQYPDRGTETTGAQDHGLQTVLVEEKLD